MTASVSKQRAFAPLISTGIAVTKQRAFVPIFEQKGAVVTRQAAFVPIIYDPSSLGRRRQLCATF